ncbi:MAG TPA: RAMP superfamily CRISPR-associated protein, partial [Nannocystis sp.]
MFKRSYNRAVLNVEIETVSPLLIKAGDSALSPTAAQLACVRTRHAVAGLTVYIPGSSLRGVLRSAAETSLDGQRFASLQGPVDGAIDPFKRHKPTSELRERESEPRKRDSKTSTPAVHREHSLTERLFGSTSIKSRCAVRDLFPWPRDTAPAQIAATTSFVQANRTELRNNVAIDRLLGSVKQGPWDAELVPAGVTFWGEITLENYEVWQLGLLTRALDALDESFANLGSGSSRGLGLVHVRVSSLIHEQPARAGERPRGVSQLADDATRRDYGLFPEAPDALPEASGQLRGLHRRFH